MNTKDICSSKTELMNYNVTMRINYLFRRVLNLTMESTSIKLKFKNKLSIRGNNIHSNYSKDKNMSSC